MRSRLPQRQKRPGRTVDPAGWLEEVLLSFADAVVVCNEHGRVVVFNQAAEELTGLARGRVMGRRCEEVFEGFPIAAAMVRRVLSTGQNESRAEETFHRPFRSIPVRVSCLAIIGASREMRGATLVICDLSRQKTLEDAARRNENLSRAGVVIAGLAHEIRNPLAGIKGAAQLLGRRLGGNSELVEYTEVIAREADRLSQLVENLLVLGAPVKPRLERLNVHALIRHVLSVMGSEFARRGVPVECRFDPSLPEVLGDSGQLTQVLLNLVRNALEAMDEPEVAGRTQRCLVVRTRLETEFRIVPADQRPRRFLRIEIVDEGRGIPERDVERLFEPFFTTKPGGTGLGLAIAYRIVAEHGGTIRAERNLPRGTCMTVSLPAAPVEVH